MANTINISMITKQERCSWKGNQKEKASGCIWNLM